MSGFITNMKLQSINAQTYKPNFSSAYPVMHWVAETNGSYAPIADLKLVKKLQGKIIRILNKPLTESTKRMNPAEERLRAYAGACDISYRQNPVARSFYNRTESCLDGFSPLSYIISGEDVKIFENYLAKNIGRLKGKSKEILSHPYSPEAIEAIRLYNNEGLKFVKKPSKQITDKKGLMYMLHTKFEIIRNKTGKIKDYRFVDAKFLPVKNQNVTK